MKKKTRMVSILSLSLAIATFLWFVPPAMPSHAQGGYGGGFIGGITPPPPPGFTSFSNKITTAGITTSDIVAKSADNLAQLTINKGTKALDKSGNPLTGIIMTVMTLPPTPPTEASIVSKTYDLTPDGATFSSPTLTLTYDPAKTPSGVSEKNLVIAFYDKTAGKWVNLASTVNPVTKTVTAEVKHFTAFSVLAYTRAAAFTTSSLSISPSQVNVRERVTISVQVTNTGDLSGSYEVTLKIDNVVVETKQVTLAGGASQTLTFTTTKDAAGTYTVNIDGLSGTFSVKAPAVPPPPPTPPAPAAFTTSSLSISPSQVNAGERVTISLRVTNTGDLSGSYDVTLKIDNVVVETKQVTLAGGASQTLTFTTTKDAAGTYNVIIDSLSGTFSVKAVEVPAKPVARWVWAIAVIVVVIAGLLVYFLWWRQRY